MSRITLIVLIIISFLISYIPYLSLPFMWFTSFFHELSQGIMAFLTGGKITSLSLSPFGGASVKLRAGLKAVVLFSGFFGTIIFGYLIVKLGKEGRKSDIIGYVIIGLIVTITAFFARDLVSVLLLIMMSLIIILMIKFKSDNLIRLLTIFLGIYVMLEIIRSIISLFFKSHIADAVGLYKATHISEYIWVAIWFLLCLIGIIRLWRKTT